MLKNNWLSLSTHFHNNHRSVIRSLNTYPHRRNYSKVQPKTILSVGYSNVHVLANSSLIGYQGMNDVSTVFKRRYAKNNNNDDEEEVFDLSEKQEELYDELLESKCGYRIRDMGYRNVFLVEEDGGALGLMKFEDAMTLAKSRGLELLMIGARRDPPVCKLVNLYKYVISRTSQNAKDSYASSGKMKSLTISSSITENDLQIKVSKLEKFLKKGFKCNVAVYFRTFDQVNKPLAHAVLTNVYERLKEKELVNLKQEPVYKELQNEVQLIIDPARSKLVKVKKEKHFAKKRSKKSIKETGFSRNINELSVSEIEKLYMSTPSQIASYLAIEHVAKPDEVVKYTGDDEDDYYNPEFDYDEEDEKSHTLGGGRGVYMKSKPKVDKSKNFKHLFE
eukprot:TRINITY_DN8711_c0_g1_i1.p1 TRINITY_DN8711_c0_g1~~TRINITY_DN8711_c0_g1_i1.p1  ORF type:complete len:391 (-),score=97.50 TRINITY_DN8711_c0_g1_i1:52-1224(-)